MSRRSMPILLAFGVSPALYFGGAGIATHLNVIDVFLWLTCRTGRLRGRLMAKIWPRGPRRTGMECRRLGRRWNCQQVQPRRGNFRPFSPSQSHACRDGILDISAWNI